MIPLAAIVGLMVVAAGCAVYTRPTDDILVPRKVVVGAVGRINGIYARVRIIEEAECKAGRIRKEQCDKLDAADAEMRHLQREIAARLQTPGYEVDWANVLKTLDTIGTVLDYVR